MTKTYHCAPPTVVIFPWKYETISNDLQSMWNAKGTKRNKNWCFNVKMGTKFFCEEKLNFNFILFEQKTGTCSLADFDTYFDIKLLVFFIICINNSAKSHMIQFLDISHFFSNKIGFLLFTKWRKYAQLIFSDSETRHVCLWNIKNSQGYFWEYFRKRHFNIRDLKKNFF